MNEALSEVLSRLRSDLTELYGERLVGMRLFGPHARGVPRGRVHPTGRTAA